MMLLGVLQTKLAHDGVRSVKDRALQMMMVPMIPLSGGGV
jgi:hypothetical protein